MNLENEREETVFRYDLDLTDDERRTLLNYAMNNISIDESDALLIEWAVVDILKKAVDEAEKSS